MFLWSNNKALGLVIQVCTIVAELEYSKLLVI